MSDATRTPPDPGPRPRREKGYLRQSAYTYRGEQRRSATWRGRVSVDGTRAERSFPTFREAEHWVRFLLGKKTTREARPWVDADRLRVRDLHPLLRRAHDMEGRRSGHRVVQGFARIEDFFGKDTRVSGLSLARFMEYVEARKTEGVAPATIKVELAFLARALRLAQKQGLLTVLPTFPTIRVDNVRTGFATAEEIGTILAALPQDLRPVIEFLSLTGWRVGEARGLTWARVDFEAQAVRLEPGDRTKTGKGRIFPFFPALGALLVRQRDWVTALERTHSRVIPSVFPRASGLPLGDFTRAWRRACLRAGVPGRLVHDLRRTAARNLVRAGVSERVAMELLGHKTRSMFDRYHIVDERDLQAATTALGHFHAAPREERGEEARAQVVALPSRKENPGTSRGRGKKGERQGEAGGPPSC